MQYEIAKHKMEGDNPVAAVNLTAENESERKFLGFALGQDEPASRVCMPLRNLFAHNGAHLIEESSSGGGD